MLVNVPAVSFTAGYDQNTINAGKRCNMCTFMIKIKDDCFDSSGSKWNRFARTTNGSDYFNTIVLK